MTEFAERLNELADFVGGVPKLARKSDIKRNTLYGWIKGPTEPRISDLLQLAGATGANLDWLLKGDERFSPAALNAQLESIAELQQEQRKTAKKLKNFDSPIVGEPLGLQIFGTAAARVSGADIFSGEVIDTVQRPPGLQNTVSAYGLLVRGKSMFPKYSPGELIFVDPNLPVRAGDIVVIQTQNHENDNYLAWLKEYKRTASDGTVVTEQYNAPAEVKFKGAQIKAMHRVMTTNEIFGISDNDGLTTNP